MPMAEWSVRLVTNNRRRASGDHCSPPTLPRVVNKFFAGAEPSTGEDQAWPFFIKATSLLSGDITGASPSDKYFTGPPAKGRLAICTLKGCVSKAGLTGWSVSQLAPWSPPRTNTTHWPSPDRDRLDISLPSSVEKPVSRRRATPGAVSAD